jgi:hypothetical protein
MRARMWSSLAGFGVTVLSCLAAQPAASADNPLGFFYDDSFRHLTEYQHPTAMLVTGRCNRYHDNFTLARARGAEVLAYINVMEQPISSPCAADDAFYKVNGANPARWIGPDNQPRMEYPSNEMLDIRVNSAWSNRVVAYIEQLMRDDQVDGVFLDVIGARLWSPMANWENKALPDGTNPDPKGTADDWTQSERDAWTAGAIDIVRRLYASREAINPRFIIVNNNTWVGALSTGGTEGEKFVDGVCLEHHEPTESMTLYANKPFGRGPNGTSSERHRRVLVIANDDAIATDWTAVGGVTHIASQHKKDETHPTEGYGSPSRITVIPLNPLVDRQKLFGKTVAGPDNSNGMVANQKRASKFALSERGRLRELSAYLDGAGGASGSQLIKLVLYADNGGLPGAKLAESNQRSFNAGAAATWYSFSLTAANQVLMNPGSYWIAIFTGDSTQLLRNYSEVSSANWYSNADPYSDGASSPFGTGTSGNVTLSVRAGYTKE